METIIRLVIRFLDWLAGQVWLPEEPAPPPVIPVDNKKELLQKMCLAIKKHEGWYEGSRSWRNNNPGNCRYSSVGYLAKYGVVEKDKDNFAIFKDYATGYLYLQNLILEKCRKNPNQNLYAFFEVYAPSFENDSKHYARIVATAMNVDPSTWLVKNLL